MTNQAFSWRETVGVMWPFNLSTWNKPTFLENKHKVYSLEEMDDTTEN